MSEIGLSCRLGLSKRDKQANAGFTLDAEEARPQHLHVSRSRPVQTRNATVDKRFCSAVVCSHSELFFPSILMILIEINYKYNCICHSLYFILKVNQIFLSIVTFIT